MTRIEACASCEQEMQRPAMNREFTARERSARSGIAQGRIAAGNYDLIIMPKSQFDRIPDNPDRERYPILAFTPEDDADLRVVAEFIQMLSSPT